jgi:hypothetical protein
MTKRARRGEKAAGGGTARAVAGPPCSSWCLWPSWRHASGGEKDPS